MFVTEIPIYLFIYLVQITSLKIRSHTLENQISKVTRHASPRVRPSLPARLAKIIIFVINQSNILHASQYGTEQTEVSYDIAATMLHASQFCGLLATGCVRKFFTKYIRHF